MGFHNIQILTYHKLSRYRESKNYTIEEKDFDSHLKFLYNNNYTCILADDYVRSLMDSSYNIPKKCVILTFDDGHESDYEIALPNLKKYNFKATFFITSDWIGTDGFMNKEQLRTLKEEGMSVQSHAKTHVFLDELNKEEVWQEIRQSKDVLEDILDKKISFLSFPGGRYNEHVLNCARNLNIKAVFSSEPFYYKSNGDFLLMGRHMVKYISGGINFEKIFNMSDIDRIKVISYSYGKKNLRKILGNKLYYKLWEKLSIR